MTQDKGPVGVNRISTSEQTYRVSGGSDVFYVVTGEGKREITVTKWTRSRAKAEDWCVTLNRTAQIESDRKRQTKG
jgi:hypothetical protein